MTPFFVVLGSNAAFLRAVLDHPPASAFESAVIDYVMYVSYLCMMIYIELGGGVLVEVTSG